MSTVNTNPGVTPTQPVVRRAATAGDDAPAAATTAAPTTIDTGDTANLGGAQAATAANAQAATEAPNADGTPKEDDKAAWDEIWKKKALTRFISRFLDALRDDNKA